MNLKKIALLIGILLNSLTSFSQTEKGKLYLGGSTSLGLNFTTHKIDTGSSLEKTGKTSAFTISPQIGYFVAKNLVAGLEMSMNFSKYSDTYNSSSNASNTYVFAPFLKYYFDVEKFRPFVIAEYGLGTVQSKYSSRGFESEHKVNTSVLILGGGITYFFNKTVGIELGLNYSRTALKPKNNSPYDVKSINNGFSSFVGFVILL